MKLLKRPVILFGKSFPLGMVLTAILTVGALAWAAFLISTWTATGTAGSSAVVYQWEVPSFFQGAGIVDDGKGVYSHTLDAQQGISGTVNSVTDESVSYASAMLRNLGAVNLFACFDASGLPPYVQAQFPNNPATPLAYGPIAPTAAMEINLWIRYSGLVPDQAIDYQMPWTLQPDPCP